MNICYGISTRVSKLVPRFHSDSLSLIRMFFGAPEVVVPTTSSTKPPCGTPTGALAFLAARVGRGLSWEKHDVRQRDDYHEAWWYCDMHE